MRRILQLNASSRLALRAASGALLPLAEAPRQAWTALPCLSALAHTTAPCSKNADAPATAARQLSGLQERQAWASDAALPLLPSAAAIQHRGFATRRPVSKRALAALERQKRAPPQPQRPQAQVAPAAHDEHAPQATGTEVVPSEAPPNAIDIASVVDHPALIVTRNIEWGTVILGFEQCNKYTVLNEKGETVALLAEDGGGLGTAVGRQLLRRRRPFTATVFTPDGSQIICRVRRPFYLIISSIMIEDGTGAVVGEVHQRWHLWRRKYDLYIGKRQFAAIDGGLFAWEFVLRDQSGGVLALIDRNFQGFGKELFTDAGKYVVHFGESPAAAAEHTANTIAAAHPDKPRPPVTALARARNELAVIPTQAGDQLDVVRGLGITERSAVLAAAVSIDFDFFSQHSEGSGLAPFFMPLPVPSYPSEEAPGEAGGAGPGAEGQAGEQGSAEKEGEGKEASDWLSDPRARDADVGTAGTGAGGAASAGAGGAVGGAAGAEAGAAAGGGAADGGFGGGWGSNGGGGEAAASSPDSGVTDLGGDEWGGDESGWGEDLSDAAGDEGDSVLGSIWDALTDNSN